MLAGPFSNFFLAVVIFSIVFVYGLPNLAPIVGMTLPGSAAGEAGIVAGDTITSIDGKKIAYWTEIDEILQASKGKDLSVGVRRGNEEKTVMVKPRLTGVKDIFGKEDSVYRLGISPVSHTLAVIGEMPEGSAAKEAGMLRGDTILFIDGRKITYWDEIRPVVFASEGKELEVIARRGAVEKTFTVKPKASREKNVLGEEVSVYLIGIQAAGNTHAVVGQIKPDSPAHKAGFLQGDKIISADGKKVFCWEDMEDIFKDASGDGLQFVVLRGGRQMTLTVTDGRKGPAGIGKETVAMGLSSKEKIPRLLLFPHWTGHGNSAN